MDFEDALFWSIALVQVVVALRFSVLMYEIPRQLRQPRNHFLARGQFQDLLVSAAVIGATFLSTGMPIVKVVLELGGAVALLWLLRRTLHRMRVLRLR